MGGKAKTNKNRRQLVNTKKNTIVGPSKRDDSDYSTQGEDCRGAYAFHSRRLSTKFEDMGFVGQFGWSSGPLADSNFAYTFDIYTDASSSDLDAGRLVGTMTVDYNGKEAVLTIDTSASSGFYPKEVHAYAGTSRLPKIGGKDIINPTHFPIAYDSTVAEVVATSQKEKHDKLAFVVSGFESDAIFIVARVTVCGDFASELHVAQGSNNPSFRGGIEEAVPLVPRQGESESVQTPQVSSSVYEAAFAKIRKFGF